MNSICSWNIAVDPGVNLHFHLKPHVLNALYLCWQWTIDWSGYFLVAFIGYSSAYISAGHPTAQIAYWLPYHIRQSLKIGQLQEMYNHQKRVNLWLPKYFFDTKGTSNLCFQLRESWKKIQHPTGEQVIHTHLETDAIRYSQRISWLDYYEMPLRIPKNIDACLGQVQTNFSKVRSVWFFPRKFVTSEICR